MTNQEAIEYLNTLYMAFAVFPNQQISLGDVDKMKESVSMAIKALEQEPKIVNLGDNVVYGPDGNLYKITVSSGKEYEQEPCEDCISRREAIKKFTYNHKGERIPEYDCDNFPVQIAMKTVKEMLRELPPVNPQPCEELNFVQPHKKIRVSLSSQPKTGHWRHYEGMLICSECGAEFYDDIMEYCGDDVPKRCPDCGAKMVEPQEVGDKYGRYRVSN